MPYKTVDDLPESVRSHLPDHAQAIYLKAFNNAWHTYHEDKESTCARVAWAAVKHEYEKGADGQWHKKNS